MIWMLTLAWLGAPGDMDAKGLFAELSAPEQKVRDEAAARLRKSYQPPARDPWDKFLAAIKPGEAKQAIVARLPTKTSEGGIGTGRKHMEEYRLDDRWLLRAVFENAGDKFSHGEVVERMRYVWVAPPETFTGTWTTYFVNGQPSHVIEYRSGKYHGTFTSNHPNGSKSVVQHYGPEGADGEDTGYYPSGKVSYRALYHAGKAVGTWRWFNEQGDVTSTQEHGE